MRPKHPLHPYLLLLPTAAILFLFFFYPVFVAFRTSLTSWDLLTPPVDVGLDNYRHLIRTGELWDTTLRTLKYSAIVVSLSVTLGLGLALALNRPGRLYAFIRGAVFSAYVVSWVAVALLWTWLLDGKGPLFVLVHGASSGKKGWLGDPDSALTALALVSVWKITGYAMVIFLAGLQDIPKSLHEAAALDGAGPVRRFVHVTLPLLRPTIAFVATTSLILSFQAFDVVRVMTQGGPVHSTTVFVYAIYEALFLNLRVGRAGALVVVFLVLLFFLTLIQLRVLRQRTLREAR